MERVPIEIVKFLGARFDKAGKRYFGFSVPELKEPLDFEVPLYLDIVRHNVVIEWWESDNNYHILWNYDEGPPQ